MKRPWQVTQAMSTMSGNRIEGYFDGIEGGRAVGWAADLEAPERVLAVEFFSLAPDGRITVLGQAPADRPRPDLASIGLSETDHGFEWAVPRAALGRRLGARFAEDGAAVPGGPVAVPRRLPPRFAGHLDGTDGWRVVGWAADLNAPGRVVEVEFFTLAPDGEATVLGRIRADLRRPDLQEIGLRRQARHGFAWPIPPLAAGSRLGSRIAGTDFALPDGPIEITTRFVGRLDRVEGSHVRGWAGDLSSPQRVLVVEFFAVTPEGQVETLGRVRANRPRADLGAAGLTGVHHGFDWRLPYRKFPFQLSARIAGGAAELPGSPVAVTPQPLYEGALDGVVGGVLRGWAWAWDPAIEVAVEVLVDGRQRAVVPARDERPDLKLAHLGDGRHGFSWVVPEALSDGKPHRFACRIAGSPLQLAGSPRRAIIPPGARSLGLMAAEPVRGHAPRPPPSRDSVMRPRLPVAAEQSSAPAALPSVAGKRRIRLLIAVWGQDYIARFSRTAFPSLLSPGNLPAIAGHHAVDLAFLCRASERVLLENAPSFDRLRGLISVGFIAIDDILARYFEPPGGGYPTALTYAFHRGVTAAGAAATDTDFIFWNADFIAADGVFRSLAELIAAGARCTFAPSLRVDAAAEDTLEGFRSADGGVLTMAPRRGVELALRFPHPTVRAQTVNRYEERMIDSVNQLYWQIDDTLVVARIFLMFMLHLRPERVWPEIYGHCDYVFAPEMVPSGRYDFVTQSDRILLLELQHGNREAGDIVYGDAPMTPSEIAAGGARWTTREHRRASQHLVLFNAADIAADLAPIRRMTDDFMDQVYAELPAEPIWHNGHFFWTDSLAALGIPYAEPGPDHPRSHLAAALRDTGWDIDIVRESWPARSGPPADIFGLKLPLDPGFDPGTWLTELAARYWRDWLDARPALLTDPAAIDLVAGRFEGFGWGLVEGSAAGWTRLLGPDGCATLLVRVPPGAAVSISLRGADASPAAYDALRVRVNDRDAAVRQSGPTLSVEIDRAALRRARGRLRLDLSAEGQPPLAFCGIVCRIE
jgi:hypothetical protein